jgi:prepilin-type N-terminal cleavage/methylation domain-containing protein
MKKMNNKGFSLVELIVVVLIMAIIAVALAPQVMKWVENSRKSTDIENYNALVLAANTASTNENVIAAAKAAGATGIVISMNSTNTTVSGDASGNPFQTCLNDSLPGWASTKITSGDWKGLTFKITVTSSTNGIQVTRGNGGAGANVTNGYPEKDFS